MQYPFIKSPLFEYGSGFFLNFLLLCIYCLKNEKKLNGISSKKLKIQIFLDLIDQYQIIHHTSQTSPHHVFMPLQHFNNVFKVKC